MFTKMPSTSTLFSTYASITGSMMLVRSLANQFIPHQLQTQLLSKLQYLFNPLSSQLTIAIDEFDGLTRNEVYEASELFLRTRISPSVGRLRVVKLAREKNHKITIDDGQEIIDVFQGIELKWQLISSETIKSDPTDPYAPQQKSDKRLFELKFPKKHKEKVLHSYLPYVLNRAETMKEENKVVKLHTIGALNGDGNLWGSINLEHPATFDTLAMDQKLKKEIMEDLDRFMKRREFYKRVGKAWKRGYLLYGPPGTGKSSLIAAMANYLKFDVYDMELANIYDNATLRRFLVATANRSIFVMEDIDCSVDLSVRDDPYGVNSKITLSGVLNLIDGLWSSCGDERIIIFTTNHKDRLDPALLRPGRMDMHINMSYCTTDGFNVLALNYLGIHEDSINKLYSETQDWIEKCQVTPAEVAEELMKSEDVETALGGLLNFLKRKKIEPKEAIDAGQDQEPKRQKTESESARRGGRLSLRGFVRRSGRRLVLARRGRG